jgi:hypothetical protein
VRQVAILAGGILVVGLIAFCIFAFRAELGLVRPEGGKPENATHESSSMEHANAGSQPTPTVWLIVDRAADGFTVEMPGSITETQIPAYNERGGVEPVEMIQAIPGAETTFAVTWADNPPVERAASENVERTLDMARNGALARTRTTLTGESRSALGVYTARDFSSRNDNGGILKARLILAGRRLYMLIATFPYSNPQREQDVSRFFSSFNLSPATNRN